MLSGRVRAALDGALFREAPRPLEEQLGALAATQLADGSRIPSHSLDPPLLGRTTAVVRNRRHVADRTDLQSSARECLNRRLSAGSRPLHLHMHALHSEVQRLARRLVTS